MFVRVNKIDGIPDDTGGKGGWWTVQPGVPDEGRPGRKAKAKKAKDGPDVDDSVDGSEAISDGTGRNGSLGANGEISSYPWTAMGNADLRMTGIGGNANGNGLGLGSAGSGLGSGGEKALSGLGFSTRPWEEPTQ